mgnify:CR=1 FL=1
MQNKIQGTHLVIYAPSSTPVKGGDLVKLGDSFYGVAVNDLAENESGIVDADGVFELPKATGAVAQGAPLYVGSHGNGQGLLRPGLCRCRQFGCHGQGHAELRRGPFGL